MSAISRFISEITMPDIVRMKLLSVLHPTTDVFDDPAKEMLFHEILHKADWDWPWHREWAIKFEAMAAIPRQWEPLASRFRQKAEREIGSYDHRAFLLHQCCAGLHFDDLRFQRAAKREWCRIDPQGDEPAPIEALILARVEAYTQGDVLAGLPPYFPGDRTSWNFTPAPKRRTYGRYNCLYHGGHPFYDG